MTTPDQIEGAPHPRETEEIFGQYPAEKAFLDAYATGRFHHAWMLTGPQGIGKATLAWRIAKFLLATPEQQEDGLFGAPAVPETLAIDPEHPVTRRITAGAEPGLKSIIRTENEKTGRMRDVISVDNIRALAGFFQLSATDGGRRVVIVDAADEMNTQAANALLKMLEEPPERAILLLVAHQPSRILPTIRSRCRVLRLHPLNHDDMARALAQSGAGSESQSPALSELSGGSVGAALRLSLLDGLSTYADLVSLVDAMPQFDRASAVKLAEKAASRGAEAQRDLLFVLLDILISRLARTGASGVPPQTEVIPGEAATLLRLSPTPAVGQVWAEMAQEISSRARHGLAVNLDPAALVLDTLIRISQTRAA